MVTSRSWPRSEAKCGTSSNTGLQHTDNERINGYKLDWNRNTIYKHSTKCPIKSTYAMISHSKSLLIKCTRKTILAIITRRMWLQRGPSWELEWPAIHHHSVAEDATVSLVLSACKWCVLGRRRGRVALWHGYQSDDIRALHLRGHLQRNSPETCNTHKSNANHFRIICDNESQTRQTWLELTQKVTGRRLDVMILLLIRLAAAALLVTALCRSQVRVCGTVWQPLWHHSHHC